MTSPAPDAPLVSIRRLSKRRAAAGADFLLEVAALDLRPGAVVALVGRSGSGKSTLLDLLALIMRPDSCDRFVVAPPGAPPLDAAAAWRAGAEAPLVALRRRHIGYVMQTGGLLPFLTVADNIALSRRLLGLPADGTVAALADRLGLRRHLAKLPGALSVGERQRVAVARALAHEPALVIADEPTAALDPITGEAVMRLFVDLVAERGVAAIVASHDWPQVERLGLAPFRAETRPGGGGGVISEFRF